MSRSSSSATARLSPRSTRPTRAAGRRRRQAWLPRPAPAAARGSTPTPETALAVDPGRRGALVARAHRRAAREHLLERHLVAAREPDRGGADVFGEVRAAARARDRHDIRTLREQPCQRELPRARTEARRELREPLAERAVLLEVLGLEARQRRAEVVVGLVLLRARGGVRQHAAA